MLQVLGFCDTGSLKFQTLCFQSPLNSSAVFIWLVMFTLVCRRQFDLANREAVDESAEWRRMFDSEAEKASKCNSELALVLSSKLLLHVEKVFFFFF